MEPYKENLLGHELPFPVDIFIQDNQSRNIIAQPHWHDCYEILYMLEGSAQQQVNDKHFQVQKNDVVILNEGDIHSTYCKKEIHTRILVVKFLPKVIVNDFFRMFEAKYINAFMNNRSKSIFHLSDAVTNSSDINRLMMGLYEEYTAKETGYEIYIKAYLYQLIASFIRNGIIKVYNAPNNEKDHEKIGTILNFIEEHYHEKIDLQMAADLLNLSYSYFSRFFKKVTGRTFKEYLDFVRVCEVEKLILSTDKNISEAAYEVGFCNVSSFNRLFKRVRGYPPKDIKRTKTANK